MRRILLCLLLSVACTGLNAQPWMPQKIDGPIKLADIIKSYKANPIHLQGEEEEHKKNDNKYVREDNDYHFNRWAWYWQQHLDANGYMVNPSKNHDEWQKYLASQPSDTRNRTTSGTTPNWVFQGPDSTQGGYWGIGRVNTVAFHPTNPKIIYAGTGGGGLWRTTDSARTWTPLYGNFPTLGVSDIVINPQNPNTIYVATGDADAWSNFSMGMMKSTDGGTTWDSTCLHWAPYVYNWIRSVVINRYDTNKLIAATRNGIIITGNGFTTSYMAYAGDYSQVLYHPTDTSIIYAAQYPTYPDSSAQILRSTNGGISWTQITHFTDVQRINLAVSPASPNMVKAIASNKQSGLQGIYNSTNSGASFAAIFTNDTSCVNNLLSWDNGLPSTGCGGQGWYDLCIAIDPANANNVAVGGINSYYSTDGGSTWQVATTWYFSTSMVSTVHADKHCLKYNPIDHVLFEGCDGGLYRCPNPLAATWDNITNGMGITQFYRNAVANGVPYCIGGAQDNGTQMVNNGIYTDLTGGDGMQPRIDYNDPSNTWYTSSQNGSISITTDAGVTYNNISSAIPDTLSGIWITPYILHPRTSTTLLVGIDILFSSTDQGGSWTAISPQFTPLSKISNIAMTPSNDNLIYVEVESAYNYFNTLHYTTNYGTTWDTISTSGFTNNISRIAIDPKNEHVLWVTFSGYGSEKVASYSTITGSWTWHNGGIPDVPVNCIVIDTFSHTKYIGTDVAVYYMDSTMSSWALYSTNLPNVQVQDLNINYSTNELWAATYGRGMWKTVKHEFPNGVSIVPYAADVINVVPNPNRGIFTITTNHTQLKGQNVNVRLIASNGTTAWSEAATFDNDGTLKVNAKGITAGVYICETANAQTIARSRVVIY